MEREKSTRMKNRILIRMYKFFNYGICILLFSAFWFIFRYGKLIPFSLNKSFRYDIYLIAAFAVLLLFFYRVYNAYLLGFFRIRTLVSSQFLSQFFTLAILYVFVSLAWYKIKTPLPFLVLLLIFLFFDCAWSYSANLLFFRLIPKKRSILLYGKSGNSLKFNSFSGKPMDRLISIEEEMLCTKETITDVLGALSDFDLFFATDISSECVDILTCFCAENDVYGFFEPNVGEIVLRSGRHIQSFHEPVLELTRKKPDFEYLFIKRAFDIFASAIGIFVLSPFMLITAIAIKAYDGGPPIYEQTRLTKDGKHFTIYKFRSMRVDAESDGKARLSTGDKDDRITPIGRIIRAIRFDELPQLFNILKGDMTIVGPRPERPEIAEEYYKTLPEFRLRLQVKAGLTGYAQIYGKYNTSPEQKLKFDLMYINNMNIHTDLRLMFATFGILFKSESTEGVAEGAITAKDINREPNSAGKTDNRY